MFPINIKFENIDVVIIAVSHNEFLKITLDELSKSLNISIQRINIIEKTLYEKFVNFCKSNIENKKIAGK